MWRAKLGSTEQHPQALPLVAGRRTLRTWFRSMRSAYERYSNDWCSLPALGTLFLRPHGLSEPAHPACYTAPVAHMCGALRCLESVRNAPRPFIQYQSSSGNGSTMYARVHALSVLLRATLCIQSLPVSALHRRTAL